MSETTAGFNEIGFLSDECCKTEIAQEISSSDYFKACCDLNELAQTMLNHLDIHPGDGKEVLTTLYIQRMLGHYQAILLMAERGMQHQVEIMLRSIIEIIFDLKAIYEHKDVFEAMIMDEDPYRKKVLERIQREQEQSTTFTESEMRELKAVISSADEAAREELKTYMKAHLAGMLSVYRTTYDLLGGAVHSTLESLKSDLTFNENNEVTAINLCEQKSSDMATLLLTAAIYVSAAVDTLLFLRPNEEGSKIHEALKYSLHHQWQVVTSD